MGIEVFKKHLREKRAITISLGNDVNVQDAQKICKALQEAKVSAIDIPYSKEIYEVARKHTKLPLVVSTFHPFEVLNAVKMGVDGVHIGNFSQLYRNGKKFSAEEIHDIVLETLSLINKYNVFVSVTIPATLEYEEKLELLNKLTLLGVDLVQSEGYKYSDKKQGLIIEDSELSISNMIDLTKHTKIDFAVSCINPVEIAYVLENGARGVTIDGTIYKNMNEVDIKMNAIDMVSRIAYKNSLNREIVRTKVELKAIN